MELKDPIEHHLQRVNALDRRQFLRPMTSSEVLERSARIYQLAARHILAKTAVPTLFCYIAIVFATTFLLPGFFNVIGGQNLSNDIISISIAAALTLFLALPLFMFGLGQSFSTSVAAVNDYITGDRLPGEPAVEGVPLPNPWEFTVLLTGTTLEAFFPLIGASGLFLIGAVLENLYPNSLLPGLFAIFGVFVAVVAFFLCPILLMRNAIVPIAAIVEQKNGKLARQRGRQLARSTPTTGGIWESMLFGLVVTFFVGLGLFLMLQTVTSLVLGGGPLQNWLGTAIFGDLIRSGIEMIPGYLLLWLLTPFWAALCTTIYYDRRIRLEGYDIRMLAKDVLEVRE